MIFTGNKYKADECLRIGLVDTVVKPEDLPGRAVSVTETRDHLAKGVHQ